MAHFSGEHNEDAPVHHLSSRGAGLALDRQVHSGGLVLPLLRHVHGSVQILPQVHLHTQGTRSCKFVTRFRPASNMNECDISLSVGLYFLYPK